MVSKPYFDVYAGMLIEDRSGAPNCVDLTADQTIDGVKTFNGELIINGKLKDKKYGTLISTTEDTATIGEQDKNVVIQTQDNIGVHKITGDGTGYFVILDSENYKEFIPVTEYIYGIKGDYHSKYGIINAPNGILALENKTVTLQEGVQLQCPGQDDKITISAALAHTIASAMNTTLFYADGNLLECETVFYQESEPEDDTSACIAWFKPSLDKWQIKSDDTENTWQEFIATPIAEIFTDGLTISRISYIGNRILDSEFFAEKDKVYSKSDIDTKFDTKLVPATTTDLGLVKPDNTTITITDDGTISAVQNQLAIDDALDENSENPVQNKVVASNITEIDVALQDTNANVDTLTSDLTKLKKGLQVIDSIGVIIGNTSQLTQIRGATVGFTSDTKFSQKVTLAGETVIQRNSTDYTPVDSGNITDYVPTSSVMSGSAPTVADLTATDVTTLVTQLNAILAQLRTRGVIA